MIPVIVDYNSFELEKHLAKFKISKVATYNELAELCAYFTNEFSIEQIDHMTIILSTKVIYPQLLEALRGRLAACVCLEWKLLE